MTDVYTLTPGATEIRPDWSPVAQPEDQHGVIAHTPNPAGYHNAGGRTMLPRGKGQWGASAGFSTRPGVVNIDPTDPVRGTGGITVDLEKVSKASFAQASQASQGNPIHAWAAAKQMQQGQTSDPVVALPLQASGQQQMPLASGQLPGYITPHTNPSGGVIPQEQAEQAPWDPLLFSRGSPLMPADSNNQIGSSSVKPPETSAMPQPVPAFWEGGSPVSQQQASLQNPQPAPVLYPPSTAAAPSAPQPPPAVPGDLPQNTVLHVLAGIMAQLQSMQNGQASGASQAAAQVKGTKEDVLQQQAAEAEKPLAEMAKYGLQFLTPEPTKPTCQVIFDLGQGGMHSKRFHYAVRRGMCLTLVYDTRYEGDQFIPSNTQEDQTIGIRIPKMNLDVRATVFDFHQRLGCMDLLNFVIMSVQGSSGGPPIVDHDDADIVHDVMTGSGEGEMSRPFSLT